MDISQWPDAKVLSLPGWMFGPRQVIQMRGVRTVPLDAFEVADIGVPDKCVVWEVHASVALAVAGFGYFELAWADRTPANAAEWSGLKKVFPYAGEQDGADWNLLVAEGSPLHWSELRVAGPASGLRPALRVDNGSSTNAVVTVSLVVSGWPRSIPQKLISLMEDLPR